MKIKSNILVTGNRNIGKTFLVKRIIEYYKDIRIAGFFTKKEQNGMVTFQVWDNFRLNNEGPKMVIYDPSSGNVYKNVFEELGVWTIDYAAKNSNFVILDELGRFEKDCKKFVSSIYRILDSELTVLAVIKAEENPFLNTIKAREDVELILLSKQNRDGYYKIIVSKIISMLVERGTALR